MTLPLPAVLLVVAALVADLIEPLSVRAAETCAVVALVVVLFYGGLDIGAARMRASVKPVLSLGILGTFLTAGIVSAAAHVLLGFDWTLAGLLGAALAPTDPAVMFAVLRGQEIEGRTRTVLEGEAGFNDPAGIALMLGMIELATHADATFAVVIGTFALQMGLGVLFGAVAAYGLRRVPAHPVLLLALAGGLYEVTALAGGSGFLAVFMAGLALGDGVGSHARVSAVAETAVFVALGLTLPLTDIGGASWLHGLVLAAVLALVARPVTVAILLARATLTINERLFVAWSGLKGAVPILLAAFAVLHDVDGASEIYGVVFVAVLISVVAQGSLVPAVARRLGLLAQG
jgi:cell volume regulation protein A